MAKNAQVQELLNPITLQTVVSSALQAAQPEGCSQSNVGRLSRPFLGKHWGLQLSAGKDGTTDPDKECHIVKIPVTN